MNQQEFNELLDNRIKNIIDTLKLKGSEYAFNSDRLHNFKVAAQISNQTPEKALWGMAMKHLVSVTDLIEERLENNRHNVNEKIGDLINYLILLEALFEDNRKIEYTD